MTDLLQRRIDRRTTELWEVRSRRQGNRADYRAQAEREVRDEADARATSNIAEPFKPMRWVAARIAGLFGKSPGKP
ncbi:hypothetical protein HNR60_003926 [Rhodopseudomonas rhenobacensis]|uniref:Uncharacterized protein n=1 Tax=Rhodopseudomonas rhenobacensis TaxID=87461 RepID=A0A7W7Z7Y9_9BRAD|nr:DUF2934 domain-containing protein [Rhodopseudomonas rhenobacensis]MBB5049152.1 hypothetical protein [Rhodopseudomonas rhenobacensis]